MAPKEESGRRVQWVGHDARVVHRSRWLTHFSARVELPDGTFVDHHFVRAPAAAIVLAVNDEEQVLLMWRHRFVSDLWGWELPGGLVDDGEEVAVTAARELEEETGFRAESIKPLLVYQPMAGMADSPHHLFLARDLRRMGEPVERTEGERMAWMSARECTDIVGSGRTLTSGTAIGLLAFLTRQRPRP
jgi:8-oxo-dGTP pyrophosphatase MutT (NUDIX family)